MTAPIRNLAAYNNSTYSPGRGLITRLMWYYVSLFIMESGWLPSSKLKRTCLRVFGANIGKGVVIKPNVRIKYPWKLTIGDHCWIGQDVWIDNLDEVTLESDVCLSQQAYLCTGSHDHRSTTFELKTGPILVKHGGWVCARATLLPGSVVEAGEVISAGTVLSKRKSTSEDNTQSR